MMRAMQGKPVMKAKCATCPFREGGDLRLQAEIIKRTGLQASQMCHHPRLAGKREMHLCRGARDHQLTILYRLGIIAAETDEAYQAASAAAMKGST